MVGSARRRACTRVRRVQIGCAEVHEDSKPSAVSQRWSEATAKSGRGAKGGKPCGGASNRRMSSRPSERGSSGSRRNVVASLVSSLVWIVSTDRCACPSSSGFAAINAVAVPSCPRPQGLGASLPPRRHRIRHPPCDMRVSRFRSFPGHSRRLAQPVQQNCLSRLPKPTRLHHSRLSLSLRGAHSF